MRFPAATMSSLLLQSPQSHFRVLKFEEILCVFHNSVRSAYAPGGRVAIRRAMLLILADGTGGYGFVSPSQYCPGGSASFADRSKAASRISRSSFSSPWFPRARIQSAARTRAEAGAIGD